MISLLPPTTDTHPTQELAPGSEIAGCRIERVAGRGGMGVVYRATQLDLGRPVAIKVIAADRARDPGLRTRFSLEARLAAAIDHPNLVPVHAAGEEGGRLYLVDAAGQVQSSDDVGQGWAELGSIGGQPGAVVSATDEELYAALVDGTVMASTDGGVSWKVRSSQ